MTRLEVARQRLRNLWLTDPKPGRPAGVVAWLGAVQAQDYAATKWAVGMRLQGAVDAGIEAAFTAGEVLRTHMLRPTWHFVTPADIRWLLAFTAPRVHAANAYMVRKLDLDEDTFRRSNDALVRALQGGHLCTRQELRQVLEEAGIAAGDGIRLSYLLMQAELEGIVVSGPRRGKQFTYALLEERVPPARHLDRQEALAELSRRYFTSRGPATVHDFARWSGLTVADARQGLEAVKDQLLVEAVDGQELWFPPPVTPEAPFATANAPVAWLLSGYDEYISSYQDRGAMVEPEVWAQLMTAGNALAYVILIDGQIVGSARRTLQKRAVTIETRLFLPLTEAQEQAVAVAAQRYGEFMGLPVALQWAHVGPEFVPPQGPQPASPS